MTGYQPKAEDLDYPNKLTERGDNDTNGAASPATENGASEDRNGTAQDEVNAQVSTDCGTLEVEALYPTSRTKMSTRAHAYDQMFS